MSFEFKLATWNVNSLKVRLPQLEQLLATERWDLVCLQETKTTNEHFPHERLAQLGYRALHLGQRAYNGVAVLARIETVKELRCVQAGLPEFDDPQQRFLLTQADDLLIASAYVPNGQSLDSEKYRYKLLWLEALHRALLANAWACQPFVLAGDFNIAPEDRDVHDPALWQGQVLCSDPERQAWRRLLNTGLQDAFRLHHANPGQYTWWDYRQLAFPRNRGLRIDHILLGGGLADRSLDCRVLREARKGVKPSDHAPVVVQLRSKDS
jgi:exodeoxyribonuclease-3